MASELTPNVSLREAAFLQPPNLATFILGQVMVAARHRRISFYKILAIAWPRPQGRTLITLPFSLVHFGVARG